MADGHVMIGWYKTGDPTPGYIDNYDTSQNPRGAGAGGSSTLGAIAGKSTTTKDGQGRTVLSFALPLTNGANSFITADGASNIIYAHGPVSTPGNIQQHSPVPGNRGTFNFMTGVSVNTDDKEKAKYRQAHGLLMAFAWGLLVPLGIISARYFKSYPGKWFLGHRVFVVTGLSLALAAFVIALVKIADGNHPLHRQLGISTMALALANPFIAAVRPHPPQGKEQPTMQRRIWAFVHLTVGRTAYVCAIVNCFIGLSYFNTTAGQINNNTIAFLVCWGDVILLAIFLEIRTRLYPDQKTLGGAKAEKETTVQMDTLRVDAGPATKMV
jgi:hypothetical protein